MVDTSSSTLVVRSHAHTTRKTDEERVQERQQLIALYSLPLYSLPAELVLHVLSLLDLEDFPTFIVAAMPLMRRCGIVKNMDTPRLRRLLMEPRQGFYASLASVADPTSDRYMPPVFRQFILHRLSPRDAAFRTLTFVPLRLRGGFERLPAELRNAIFSELSPVDKVNLVLACFRFSDEDIEHLTHEKV